MLWRYPRQVDRFPKSASAFPRLGWWHRPVSGLSECGALGMLGVEAVWPGSLRSLRQERRPAKERK